jgi:hypothetical protein
MLLQGLEFRIRTFFFSFFFLFIWQCASVLPLGYCVVANPECNGISMLLIYFIYQKSNNR